MEKSNLNIIDQETESARTKLTGIVMAMMLEGLCVETIVLAMLKMSAIIVRSTGGTREVFLKLAGTAFDSPRTSFPPVPPTKPPDESN